MNAGSPAPSGPRHRRRRPALRVHNVHERVLAAPPSAVGRLLDTLASDDDRLWPHEHWPSLRLDPGLQPGAAGGHGRVRYEVVDYEPGRRVRFRCTRPTGLAGYHEFSVENVSGDTETRLAHRVRAQISGTTLFTWPVFFRPLHDALIEDAFDKAEMEVMGTVRAPTSWSPVVRGWRAVVRRARRIGNWAQHHRLWARGSSTRGGDRPG